MTIAVLPAFNESQTIGEVCKRTLQEADQVIVVDDHSKDHTYEAAKAAGAHVLRHAVQRGAGRATATGIVAALRLQADFIVTLDADGQHLPEEIPGLVEPLRAQRADLTLGCRTLNRQDMPILRQLGNHAANWWTWLLFGIHVSDSQSGYRGLTQATAQKLPLEARGYEFCSLTLGAAARLHLRIEEVPITTIYTDYSRSKGQSVLQSVKTLAKIGRASLR